MAYPSDGSSQQLASIFWACALYGGAFPRGKRSVAMIRDREGEGKIRGSLKARGSVDNILVLLGAKMF